MGVAWQSNGHHGMFYATEIGWFFDPRGCWSWPGGSGVEAGQCLLVHGSKDPVNQRPFRDALSSLGFSRGEPAVSVIRQRPRAAQFARANLRVENLPGSDDRGPCAAMNLVACAGSRDLEAAWS